MDQNWKILAPVLHRCEWHWMFLEIYGKISSNIIKEKIDVKEMRSRSRGR